MQTKRQAVPSVDTVAGVRLASRLLRGGTMCLFALVLFLAAPAHAQVETPPPGSPVRAAILDAVRGRVVSELGAPIEFVVNDLRVLGEWAFVDVHPQRPGGGAIFYIFTRYEAAWNAGALDQSAQALLRLTPAGWLVYEFEFGATDVGWLPWVDLYPAPREVFPLLGPGK